MVRIATIAGVEIAAGESHFAERAQTLKLGCLVHPTLPREECFSGNSRQITANATVGASLRKCRSVVEITPASITARTLPLAF